MCTILLCWGLLYIASEFNFDDALKYPFWKHIEHVTDWSYDYVAAAWIKATEEVI